MTSSDYPPFFYPKLAALSKTFLPKLETVYYIHNFKGRNGGTLFRSVSRLLTLTSPLFLISHISEESFLTENTLLRSLNWTGKLEYFVRHGKPLGTNGEIWLGSAMDGNPNSTISVYISRWSRKKA